MKGSDAMGNGNGSVAVLSKRTRKAARSDVPPSENLPTNKLSTTLAAEPGPVDHLTDPSNAPTAPSAPTAQEALSAPSAPTSSVQDALVTEKDAPPTETEIADRQFVFFDRIITRDRTTDETVTESAILNGDDIWLGFEIERAFLRDTEIKSAYSRYVGSFKRRFEAGRNGKTAQTERWVKCSAMSHAARRKDTENGFIPVNGSDPRGPLQRLVYALPVDTLVTLAGWLKNDEAKAHWTVRPDRATDLFSLLSSFADRLLTSAEVKDKMAEVDRAYALAHIQTLTGAARSDAERTEKRKRRAARTSLLGAAIKAFGDALDGIGEKTGHGVSSTELLRELIATGLLDDPTETETA